MENLFEISNLYLQYNSRKGVSGREEKVNALNGIDLNIKRGEILAIAGESGCGKSTLAKALIRLVKPQRGIIKFEGQDLAGISSEAMKAFRQKVQMVFQNPYASLNPKMKIYEILEEPLVINTSYPKDKRQEVILEKISQVGLDKDCLEKYPHEFSGGQRQRIAIARALLLEPVCIVADEPVSALDVSIQAQIINLLKDLKEKYNLTIIFISHDLRVIKYLSDRVAVMYLGEIVELAPSKELFSNPKHPYTKALLNAIPSFEKKKIAEDLLLKGDLPSVTILPKGCLFHTRCPQVMEICRTNHPILEGKDCVRCWLYNRLTD